LAMVLGMLPIALGVGEGGGQNAPLGRAVIGGLLVATFVTLFIVPVMYSVLRRNEPSAHRLDERFLEERKDAHRGALPGTRSLAPTMPPRPRDRAAAPGRCPSGRRFCCCWPWREWRAWRCPGEAQRPASAMPEPRSWTMDPTCGWCRSRSLLPT